MSFSVKLRRVSSSICHAQHNAAVWRHFSSRTCLQDAQSHLPRVVQPALWRSMIPKAFRKDQPESEDGLPTVGRAQSVGEKNPGLPLIILGLLAGSFAINIISLKREMTNFSRKTETKLALLREVIKRVKNGEDVDVKRLLGTGDPQSEQEWEEVIQELENTNSLTASRVGRRAKQAQSQPSPGSNRSQAAHGAVPVSEQSKETSGPKFMM